MKNNLMLLLVGLTFNIVHTQNVSDAMRYVQNELNGTARFTAMSGAFGALGGDLSSINVNPAGSAVFANNQFAFTMSNYSTKNKLNYFGTQTSTNNTSFDINQVGGVFVFKNKNPNSDWKKFSLAINYENTNNYDNFLFSSGMSPVNSVANYFLSYANGVNGTDGVPLGLIQSSNYADLKYGAQQAFLGYEGYIINPVTDDGDNALYTSNVRSGGNYYQENSVASNGYNGKLIFNTATQYKDKIYFGVNLNAHFTDYVQTSDFYESNKNSSDLNYGVHNLSFTNNLHTWGSGFSFQLGAIAKVTNEIRLGLAYESPTWYHLNDELSQRLVSIWSNSDKVVKSSEPDSDIINVHPPYNLDTPGSFTGSIAYVFGKTGLLSVDYKCKDYSSTQFRPANDPYYREVNNTMDTTFGTTSEIRVGGEYKVDRFSLRGGYRFEESPYKNVSTMGDLNSFSGGLGCNFGAIKLDLSYVYSRNTSQQPFFSQGFTESAYVKTCKNDFVMTLLFEM